MYQTHLDICIKHKHVKYIYTQYEQQVTNNMI